MSAFAYYNEWHGPTAAWLRELMKQKLIPNGVVDTRSILEVTADDIREFKQVHFFAGIGGWPLALRMSGVPDDAPVWTGSPPCQPFSVAGKQVGFEDKRHLAPVMLDLVAECRPAIIFGEQVASAISKHWLDFIFADMEAEGYACASAVLPACSVGSPHKRERLFFCAMGDDFRSRWQRWIPGWADTARKMVYRRAGCDLSACGLEYTTGSRQDFCSGASAERQSSRSDENWELPIRPVRRPVSHLRCSADMGIDPLSNANRKQWDGRRIIGSSGWPEPSDCNEHGKGGFRVAGAEDHSPWRRVDWLRCRDGYFRPVEPRTFPLANGIPQRVGLLRGYGNAIVPQVAEKFIRASLVGISDMLNGDNL